MHAFLIIGTNKEAVDDQVNRLVKKFKSQPIHFNIDKIEEVRNLEQFTKLTLDKPTSIIIKDVQNSSVASLNAFLKSLEEPQKKLSFILTTTSYYALPSTVVSRCQIIKTHDAIKLDDSKQKTHLNFINQKLNKKLEFLDKITSRDDAIVFLQELSISCRSLLYSNKADKIVLLRCLKSADKTLSAIEKNGNVRLQLTNFCVNI
jgi:DNA polymerase III gamma/tau subunit